MKTISKSIIYILIILAMLLGIAVNVYASNEGISVVKGDADEYLVYINGHEKTQFEFAYTNDNTVDKATLRYKAYATDTLGNKIAYVNSTNKDMFNTTTYMYARKAGTSEYIINGVEIDLNKKVEAEKIEEISNVTKKITVDTTQSVTIVEEVGDKKVTVTKGKIVLPEKTKEYEYQMIKVSDFTEYDELMELINRIAGFTETTPMSVKVETYAKFMDKYEELMPGTTDSDWSSARNNEIMQPEDAEDGEVYIVWIKDSASGLIDMQIMTAKKDYKEEKISPKLPQTGLGWAVTIILPLLILVVVILMITKGAKIWKERRSI